MEHLNISAKFVVRWFTHSWDNRGTQKIWGVSGFAHFPILPNFKGLLFAWTLWIYQPSLKFVALPVLEIIGGTQKNLGSPCIRPRSIFSKILIPFCSMDHLNISANLTFVALPIPEIIGGTSKIRGVPGFARPLNSPKFLKGFCSHGHCEYTWQVWSS